MPPAQLFQVADADVAKACNVPAAEVETAGLVCRNVFRWTENEFLARAADWLATAPLRIILILVIAVLANRLVRRVIKKSVAELTDKQANER